MIEKTIYVAEDGTTFENKGECIYHERLLKGKEGVLQCLQGLEDYCRSVNDCHDCVISNLCDILVNNDREYGNWTEFIDLINKG